MKHESKTYVDAVRAWDKVHRIVGKEDPARLYKQSKESLSSALKAYPLSPTLVDIGAGSGMMAWAWLELSPNHKAILVEPKKKSQAFLLNYITGVCPELAPRVMVIGALFDDVSRETVAKFAPEGFFCVARAFSGTDSLETVIARSEFSKDPCYVFSADIAQSGKQKYSLNVLSQRS